MSSIRMLPPRAILTLPNDTSVEVERIGKGRYTTAWRNSNFVYCITSEADSGKELLSRLESSPNLPCIEYLGPFGDLHKLYRLPLYQPLTAKHMVAWAQFKILHQYWQDAQQIAQRDAGFLWVYAQDINNRFEELVMGNPAIPPSISEAIQLLVSECPKYGEYCIEITKKNCAVDDTGNLILLDPVFDLEELRQSKR